MVKKIRLVDKPDGDVTKTTGSGGDGSNPALIGFILRPQEKIRRHTYENILEKAGVEVTYLPIK